MQRCVWFVVAGLTLGVPIAAADDVTLLATAELEYVNVAGGGGPADSGLIRPRGRAPYVDLDKATLDASFALEPWLAARLELRANRQRAFVDRVYVESLLVDDARWQIRAELGRQKPIERPPERRVEAFSPLGAVFWRGREWHAGVTAARTIGRVTVDAAASIAMQRGLGDEAMGEDPMMPTIAFVHTELDDDSAAELGGLAGVGAHGARVAVFAFRGRLLDDAGPTRLRETFPDDYHHFFAEGEAEDLTSRWYGARVAYDGHGVHALGEAIVQDLGKIRRRGFELGAGYVVPVVARGRTVEVEPFFRYGQLTTTNLPERFMIPESWDREQYVTAALIRPSPAIEVKVEYLALRERTGEGAVSDDQLLVHMRLVKELL